MEKHASLPGVVNRGRAWAVGLAALALVAGATPARAQGVEAARAAVEARIAGSGADVAVVFRTLDGKDEWLRRPDDVFHAASTMKIPVMIELFDEARRGSLSLDDTLVVKNEFHSIVDQSVYRLDPADDSETDLYKAEGETRTLRALCELMITASSNLATNLLIDRLGIANVRRMIHDLNAGGMQVFRGVEDMKAYQLGLSNTTSARALYVMLDALARGRAVDPNASREMVDILKRQRFNDGIPAGVPPGTPVAHKTGSITRIHHDAAIVYAPRPFVLVILTRGIDDQKQSAALMADITRLLYEAAK